MNDQTDLFNKKIKMTFNNKEYFFRHIKIFLPCSDLGVTIIAGKLCFAAEEGVVMKLNGAGVP